jgi:hypothetical protein
MSPQLKELINKRFVVLRIIWFAMMASQFMFAFQIIIQPRTGPAPPINLGDMFVLVLGLAGLLCLYLSRFLIGWMMPAARFEKMRQEPATAEELRAQRTQNGLPLYTEDMIAKLLALPLNEQIIYRGINVYSTPKILQWVLCEACGTFGFLLAFLKHQPVYFVVLGGLALLGILAAPPSPRELLRNIPGATPSIS